MKRYPICPECQGDITPEDCARVLDAQRNVFVFVLPDTCPHCDLAFNEDEDDENDEEDESDRCRCCGRIVPGCAGECDRCFGGAVDKAYETLKQQELRDHA